MKELIQSHLEDIKDKELISLIDEAFFNEEIDKGMVFKVRRSNFLRGKRTLNIVDEIEEKMKIQKAFEEAEAKRDMTYEEYLEKYQQMMDGKGGRDDHMPTKSGQASRPVTGHEEMKSDNGSKKVSAGNKSTYSNNGGRSGLNSMANTKEGFGSAAGDDSWKTEIPESCLLTFMKGNKIADLDKKFVLLSHPYPIIEGEMIMFQPFDQDQYDEQLIVYRDFSLRKRYPTQVNHNKKLTSFQQKQLETDDQEKSKLNSLEIDLFTPLSHIDWKCFADLIDEVQGLGWVQVLPVGEKSS